MKRYLVVLLFLLFIISGAGIFSLLVLAEVVSLDFIDLEQVEELLSELISKVGL